MSNPEVSISICTRRFGGLITQLKLLNAQSFKDFEVVIVDGIYGLRKEEVDAVRNTVSYNIIHVPPKENARLVGIDQASMRNTSLIYASGKYVLFFDDYQIPDTNFVLGHVEKFREGYCTKGRQIYISPTDFDGDYKLNIVRDDSFGLSDRALTGSQWYTHSSGAPLSMLIEINGFDERSDGGTGGEDYMTGVRLGMAGAKFIYASKSLCYHMEHGGMRIYPASPTICNWIQSVGYDKGEWLSTFPLDKDKADSIDWDNVSKYKSSNHKRPPYNRSIYKDYSGSATLTVWVEEGIMFFKCKICGYEGPVDSIPVIQSILANKSKVAPKKYFDLKEAIKVRKADNK